MTLTLTLTLTLILTLALALALTLTLAEWMSIGMPPVSAISCLFSSLALSLRSAPATRACTLALS